MKKLRVSIVTDSTADLPPGIADELGIKVIPLYVHFGEEVYKDRVDLSAEDFYKKLLSGSVMPKTSAPSPDTFNKVYNSLAKETDAIISIHISPKLSATCEAARVGSQGISCPVSIIDSQSASMACGLLVMKAARAAATGVELKQVEIMIRESIPHAHLFGLLDTLEYLHKGGRIGKAQAFLGSLLGVKPVLEVIGGEVLPVIRARSRAKGLDFIIKKLENYTSISEMAVIYNTRLDEAESLLSRLSGIVKDKKIHIAQFGPVLGTYVGPGSIAISLLNK
ncbi:MAG: DegV family protein [Chloroflexi bacterium]|nr:DegV family protein [Chloroflexota bacterium]